MRFLKETHKVPDNDLEEGVSFAIADDIESEDIYSVIYSIQEAIDEIDKIKDPVSKTERRHLEDLSLKLHKKIKALK